MISRKTLMTVVFLTGSCGFAFRWGEHQAVAVDPNPCVKQPCRDAYGWWSTNDDLTGTKCYAAEKDQTDAKGGPGPSTHTTHAIPSLYATVSNGNSIDNDGKFDKYIYPNNSLTCGKENGSYQSPQEVIPSGVGVYSAWTDKLKCSTKSE